MSNWYRRSDFLSVVAALCFAGALPGCTVDADTDSVGESEDAVGEAASACHQQANETFDGIPAAGSFSCDFGLAPGPMDQVPGIIERDRMYMAARPGMITKRLPILFNPDTGETWSGGRYLFDTYEHAVAYKNWVTNSYALDGVLFLQRPLFINPECHAYKVIGLHETAALETSQYVYRTERWHVSQSNVEDYLRDAWPHVRDVAVARGYKSVWLTYSPQDDLVQLVYFANRVGPAPADSPDFASLAALRDASPLGDALAKSWWTKSFDRTEWILTDWYPFQAGDHGRAALWPNSPPFPAPTCGDGLCEVSRGENATTCAADCPAHCGNGVCNAGENTHNCPGDCRL